MYFFRIIAIACFIASVAYWVGAEREGEMVLGAICTVFFTAVVIRMHPRLFYRLISWMEKD